MQLRLKGDISELLEELLFGKYQYTSWELEIKAMLQNAEISPVTLLNSVPITDAHPTISKILRTLTGNICSGVNFSMVIDG